MTFKRSLRYAVLTLAFFAFAGIASAQGPVTDTNTTYSNLTMSATVQTSVSLNIETHASGATVGGDSSTGAFTLAFGNVNGLGTGTPGAGITESVDASGTLYTTPITLKPQFSGFTGTETADITLIVGGGANDSLAREGATAATVAAIPTIATAVVSDAADNSSNTRYVGFYVARSTTTGAKTAILKYTITVQL